MPSQKGRCEVGRCTPNGEIRCEKHATEYAVETMEQRGWVIIKNEEIRARLMAIDYPHIMDWRTGWNGKVGFGVWTDKLGAIVAEATSDTRAIRILVSDLRKNESKRETLFSIYLLGGPMAAGDYLNDLWREKWTFDLST